MHIVSLLIVLHIILGLKLFPSSGVHFNMRHSKKTSCCLNLVVLLYQLFLKLAICGTCSIDCIVIDAFDNELFSSVMESVTVLLCVCLFG